MDLSQTAQMLEATARAIYKERGPNAMHPGQWSVLRFLAGADEKASDLNGVAKYLGVTAGPASRALAALEEKGLVIGEVRLDDRRKRRMRLSKSGIAALENDPIKRVETILKDLPQDQQTVFEATLKHLHTKLIED
ncbi:MarR family winged helix-turn-helix transcriptional regulator [Hirschia baltica]|uniref:Transcriptional regulator, MarR family n=1 Tax=Hirschia baltica (strain ATCC 49814 / DSM 5838 / IFAM 1418) TaxID=582402 RepID=C6XMB4_HIRBI|nr:MarR family transcriptional regulator [Hirschia baltica]ACT58057.1 transcriptional regulator, MarR family [Hirschia baltica ATCC 49814]